LCFFSCFSRYGITILFQIRKELQWKALKQSGSVLGLIIVLFLSKGMFSFLWVNDDYYLDSYGPEFIEALKGDRMSLYSADLLRSGFFFTGGGTLWLFIKTRLLKTRLLFFVGLFMVSDLFFVDKIMFQERFCKRREIAVL
jgi:hypothetical protein